MVLSGVLCFVWRLKAGGGDQILLFQNLRVFYSAGGPIVHQCMEYCFQPTEPRINICGEVPSCDNVFFFHILERLNHLTSPFPHLAKGC